MAESTTGTKTNYMYWKMDEIQWLSDVQELDDVSVIIDCAKIYPP